VGSHCPSRVHARSDARKTIDKATMRRRRRSREGEEGKYAESVAPRKKTILWAFFFFHFAKCEIANTCKGLFFTLHIILGVGQVKK